MKNRTPGQWSMHHALVGQLTSEISSIISNEAKLELLQIIKEFKQKKIAEWVSQKEQQTPTINANLQKWLDI